jgi:hypothetical protein
MGPTSIPVAARYGAAIIQAGVPAILGTLGVNNDQFGVFFWIETTAATVTSEPNYLRLWARLILTGARSAR